MKRTLIAAGIVVCIGALFVPQFAFADEPVAQESSQATTTEDLAKAEKPTGEQTQSDIQVACEAVMATDAADATDAIGFADETADIVSEESGALVHINSGAVTKALDKGVSDAQVGADGSSGASSVAKETESAFREEEDGILTSNDDSRASPSEEIVCEVESADAEQLEVTDEEVKVIQDNLKSAVVSTTASKVTVHAPVSAVMEGVYNIYSVLRSDAALDVAGAATNNGAKVQIYSDNTTPAQRWRIESLGNGFYKIINVASEKVLDVMNGKAFSGNKVQQYVWNGTKAQQWKITTANSGVTITSALSNNLVLDVRSANKNNGTQIQVYNSNNTKAQIWRLDQITQELGNGYYVFTNAGSGLAVDITSGSLEDRGNVQQYSANGTLAQTYQVTYNKTNGYYTLRNVGSGKALDVANGATKNGSNVQQYSPNNTWAQYWDISRDKSNVLTIKSAKSGRALDVSGGSKKKSANIQIWSSNGTPAQKWKATKVTNWLPEGTYFIHSSKAHNNVVEVKGGLQDSNTNIQSHTKNGGNAQRFYFRPTGNGYYTIQNTFSGKYLDAASNVSDANVFQATTREQWKPILRDNGIVFQLKNNPNVVLDLSGGSTKNGANIKVHTSNGTLAQKWLLKSTQILSDGIYEFESAAQADLLLDGSDIARAKNADFSAHQLFELRHIRNGKYRVVNLATGKALQVNYSSNTSEQGSTSFVSYSGANTQQWIPKLNTDGTFTLASTVNGGKSVLDLTNAKTTSGIAVQVRKSNGKVAQKWNISSGTKRNYNALTITLAQIVQWNWDNNSYTRKYAETIDKLREYMDPANGSIYQFTDLRQTTPTTDAQLDAFIASHPLGSSGKLKGMGSAFIAAAKKYSLNQDYLLAHAILESAWGTSNYAKGTKVDKTTYYNFYGIGAYDSSPDNAVLTAGSYGWSSPTAAIEGAAKWIADNYVYRANNAQYTLYGMKWDYAYSDKNKAYGWHQYATDPKWSQSIARIMGQIYSKMGTGDNLRYVVPTYK